MEASFFDWPEPPGKVGAVQLITVCRLTIGGLTGCAYGGVLAREFWREMKRLGRYRAIVWPQRVHISPQ